LGEGKAEQVKPGMANLVKRAKMVIVAGPLKFTAVVSVGVHRMAIFGACT
jgi:hypothetical protein